MQSYKRKITYFYQYHNGNVGATAGFLKLEIRGDKVKIHINIQEPPGLPYSKASLYFYHEAGDHLSGLKVDEVEGVGGRILYQNRTDWQQMFDTGRDLYTFDGVAVVYNDTHYYIGDFMDKNRRDYPLVKKEGKPTLPKDSVRLFEEYQRSLSEEKESEEKESEEKEEESLMDTPNEEITEKKSPYDGKKEDFFQGEEPPSSKAAEALKIPEKEEGASKVFSLCEDCPYQKKQMEQSVENALEKMLAEYPKLPMYHVTELFDCVRIHPKDIGKLDMRNWKLGVNSFLTHGFYTYQYLLLGKMRFDNGIEHPIIGVPGVYSNREKYLANMFGFEQFIPVKKTGTKTGEFGYWIVELQTGD